MQDVMLDLETMSTSSNAAIVAIGACKFDTLMDITDTFYTTVNLSSCIKKGFDVDGDTVCWWMKQEDTARKHIYQTSNTMDIKDALIAFQKWLGKDNTRIWGNGADFDNAILSNAFRKFGVIKPWNYGLNRCFRTIKASFPKIELPDEGTKHNALDDAIWQAKYLLKLVDKHKLNGILE